MESEKLEGKIMIRRIGKVLMAAVISASLVAAPFTQGGLLVKASAETKDEIPQGYTPIYNIEDLHGINNDLSGNYILMNDIDLSETAPGGRWDSGHGWTPIGTEQKESFGGQLNGNGFYIKNMHIYGDPGSSAGLFRSLYHAGVKNLGIVDCDIAVKRDGETNIGGIAGTSNFMEISSCFVTGKIAGDSNESVRIGGIIGYDIGGWGYIEDCYNAAQIMSGSSGSSMGGITGSAYDIYSDNFQSCYNTGMIEGAAGQNVGGICGTGKRDGNDLYYLNASVSGERLNDWGTALNEAQMKSEKSFSGFNFADTWYVDHASDYGYPQLKNCPQARIAGIELTSPPDKLEYTVGEELELTGGVLSILYENGVRSSVSLESDIVSGYDADKPGIQTILVSYVNNTVSFEVEVKEILPEGLELDHEEAEIDRGGKLKLNASFSPHDTTNQSLAWETDNELVATVSEDGEVKGINAGEAVITAETVNGIKASCTVKVNVPAKKLKLSVGKLQLKKGQKKTVKATMTPLDATDTITWLSSNSKIASVNSKGVVTAKKQGSAVIMAKTSGGVSKKIKVTVTNNGTNGGNLTRSQAEKKLVKWLKEENQYDEANMILYEYKEGNGYVFGYYENSPDFIHVIGRYYVNSQSGKITIMPLVG